MIVSIIFENNFVIIFGVFRKDRLFWKIQMFTHVNIMSYGDRGKRSPSQEHKFCKQGPDLTMTVFPILRHPGHQVDALGTLWS